MEAFKLLSRSTNLKPAQASRRERRILHVPSEGQTRASVEEENVVPSAASVAGRKRKRDAFLAAREQDKASTPNAIDSHNTSSNGEGKADEPSGHEALSQEKPTAGDIQGPQPLSSDECRQVFKSHKIKMAALAGALDIDDSVRASSNTRDRSVKLLSRKRRKEASSLYTQPLTSFTLLPTLYKVSRTLLNNLREQGYTTPTEVQLATIPVLLDPVAAGLYLSPECPHVDLLTVAPTGSGKTLAFLIPLINHLIHDHHRTCERRQKVVYEHWCINHRHAQGDALECSK